MHPEFGAALTSFGYRRMKQFTSFVDSYEVWGKPVGYVCFTVVIYERRIVFTDWFKAKTGVAVWCRSELAYTDAAAALAWLKSAEADARTDLFVEQDSQFEFTTVEDTLMKVL